MILEHRHKTYPAKDRKNGVTKVKTVLRQCDVCKNIDETTIYTVLRSRKKRKSEIDLCSDCARKNRVMPTGNEHKSWKHGKTNVGYKRINIDGQRVLEHAYLMEQKIGRKLQPDECVHHIDFDKSNNQIDNLYLFLSSAHRKCHGQAAKLSQNLLHKLIWFDYEKQVYTDQKTISPNFKNISIEQKIYTKTDPRSKMKYSFVIFKISNNKWKWRRLHVHLMELLIGRKIFRDECVHHIDGNTLNNELNNLALMTVAQHRKCHYSLEICTVKLMKRGLVEFDNGVYRLSTENIDSQDE